MQIYIEDLRFEAIIGLLDFERVSLQEVIVNIQIGYLFEDEFIDYAKVSELTRNLIIESKFILIEDALNSLSKHLKNKFPQINTLHLKITKPSILANCRVSVGNIYQF